MSNAAARLIEDRATREAALQTFSANLAQVKADYEARGIGGRIADKASEEVRAGVDEALAIAEDNKGVVATTIAVLILWLLRNPLIDWLNGLLHADPTPAAENPPEVQEPELESQRKSRRKAKEPTA